MHFLVLLSALLACAAGVPFNSAQTKLDGRIEGGHPAQIEHHPHQVALLNSHDNSLKCGGSIISPTCVVTAAHCVEGMHPDSLHVRAGSTHYSSGGTLHKVTHGFYHGSYNPKNKDYDVAVLKVDPPFTFSDSVENIILQESELSPGTNTFVTGWGSTSPGGPHNPSLLEAIVQIRDPSVCTVADSYNITDNMVCAASNFGFSGPCDGDDGGPLTSLYCPRRLLGIVSSKLDCGNPHHPAVYTKVSAVGLWIKHLCSAQIIPKGITKADAIP